MRSPRSPVMRRGTGENTRKVRKRRRKARRKRKNTRGVTITVKSVKRNL